MSSTTAVHAATFSGFYGVSIGALKHISRDSSMFNRCIETNGGNRLKSMLRGVRRRPLLKLVAFGKMRISDGPGGMT